MVDNFTSHIKKNNQMFSLSLTLDTNIIQSQKPDQNQDPNVVQ